MTISLGLAVAVIGTLTLLAAASSFLPHVLKRSKNTRVLGSMQLLAGEPINLLFFNIFYLVLDFKEELSFSLTINLFSRIVVFLLSQSLIE